MDGDYSGPDSHGDDSARNFQMLSIRNITTKALSIEFAAVMGATAATHISTSTLQYLLIRSCVTKHEPIRGNTKPELLRGCILVEAGSYKVTDEAIKACHCSLPMLN